MTGSDNGPGKSAIDYRVGTTRTFLAQMRRTARQTPPLDSLNTDAASDFSNALMGAWARVCDVLSFYQERIANEAYLGTARTLDSVVHLGRLLGVTRRPAVGAETCLALQLIDARGAPGTVTVTAGGALTVQNTPPPGELPVVFEASERITLSSAFNAIALHLPSATDAPRLWPGDTSLRISGTTTGLRAGSAVLIEARAGDAAVRAFVIVDRVAVDRARRCTLMIWNDGIRFGSATGPVAGPVTIEAITLLRRTAGLFGNAAMDWDQLPPSRQRALGVRAGGLLACRWSPQSDPAPDWAAVPNDLPADIGIRVLAMTPAGSLLAGTASGLFRSVDGGTSWTRAALVPATADIHALHCASDGAIFAGGARGVLAVSTDDGISWAALPTKVTATSPATIWQRLMVTLGRTAEPEPLALDWRLASTIRAVVWVPAPTGDAGQIAIGTDQGVFVMTSNSLAWRAFNTGFPGINHTSGAADLTIHALAWGNEGLTAATSAGLFVTAIGLAAWRQIDPVPAAYCLARQGGDAEAPLLVGTQDGIYQNVDGRWTNSADNGWSMAGLAGQAVTSLAAGAAGVVAATDAGLCWQAPADSGWQAANQQDLLLFSVDALFADALDQAIVPAELRAMFARWGIDLATKVKVTPQAGSQILPGWALVEPPEPVGAGRSFRIARGPRLLVSQLVDCPEPVSAVLVAGAMGLAATAHGPLQNRNWPDFQIADGRICLDRSIPELETGGQLVLAPAGITMVCDPAVYPVKTAVTAAHAAFGKQASVTQIDTDADARLQLFDLRTTMVYLASTALTAYAPSVVSSAPLAGDRLTLAGNFDALGSGRAVLVSGPRPAAVVTRMGGVFIVDGTAPPRAAGLANLAVLALVSTGQSLFAATSAGLFRQAAGAGEWIDAGAGLPGQALVTCLAAGSGPHLIIAGTRGDGVFRRAVTRWPETVAESQWRPVGHGLTGKTINAVAQAADHSIYAATSEGVFRHNGAAVPHSHDWTLIGPARAATHLAAGGDGQLYAVCGRTVAVLRAAAGQWHDLPPLPSDASVTALAVVAGGGVLAGLRDGQVAFHSDAGEDGGEDGGEDAAAWQPVERLPGGAPVNCLLVADHVIYAGARGAGVFAWRGAGPWQPVPCSVSNDVRALVLNSDHQLLAGCDAAVQLSLTEPCVLQLGQPLLLAAADSVPALAQQMLPPALTRALAAAGVTLSAAAAVTILDRDRAWLLRDADLVWVIVRCAPDDPDTITVRAGDLVDVLTGPAPDDGRWRIAAGTATAIVTPLPGELVWQPARLAAAPISEVAVIAAVEDRGIDRMDVRLTGALQHRFDAARVRISANLVRATQGETVEAEVLGSGNHAQAFQQFRLARAPLTYCRDADGAGVHSSLRIEVNSNASRALRFGGAAGNSGARGEHWHHSASFLHDGPADRVYMAEADSQGRTSVRFGDGSHGARLPTGTDNVTAHYRYGAGRSGNVAAGTLIALRKRPAGIRSVINPAAAHGGQDAESLTSLRRRVPQEPRRLERIVTFDDYGDFVRAFPGIGSIEVDLLSEGGQPPTLCIWAATDDGRPLTAHPALRDKLVAAIEACRSDAIALHIGAFTPVPFAVAAVLKASREADPAVLRRRAEALLVDRFALGRQPLGTEVSATELKTMLAGLPGVVDADIMALHTTVTATGRAKRLHPARARIDPASGAIIPPEALIIDPDGIAVAVRQP